MFINDFFVYQLIYVPLENISLIGNRIHCRWRIANLDLCLVPLVTDHGGIFIAPHLLRHWASASFVHPLDRPSLVAFQEKQKVQRTYSNLASPMGRKTYSIYVDVVLICLVQLPILTFLAHLSCKLKRILLICLSVNYSYLRIFLKLNLATTFFFGKDFNSFKWRTSPFARGDNNEI